MRKGGRKGGSERVTCLVLSNWCIKYNYYYFVNNNNYHAGTFIILVTIYIVYIYNYSQEETLHCLIHL